MHDGSTGQPGGRSSFADWTRKLQADASLTAGLRESYRHTILDFLGWCRRRQDYPSVVLARQFVEVARLERAPSPARLQEWKDGLNWLFRQKREAPAPLIQGLAPLARSDQGRADWERQLIARLRLKRFSWRTEQTYRGWAWRLARFLKGRPLSSATGADVRAFLSHLAVEARVSAATQKQALNALVFFLREVTGIEPGDFSDFDRARQRVRVPVVLKPRLKAKG